MLPGSGSGRKQAGLGECLRPWSDTACGIGHRLQGEAVEDLTHVFAGCFPDRKQHALAFVVARTVLVRLAEVAEGDRSVDCAQNLADANLLSGAGEHIATADTALRSYQSGALQREQDLLEVRLRQSGAFRNVANRGGNRLLCVQRER